MEIVKNLQSKTDKQKRKILVISLIVSMLVVTLVLFFQMKNYSFSFDNTQLSPLVDIKDQAVGLYSDSVERVNNIKEIMGENDESVSDL